MRITKQFASPLGLNHWETRSGPFLVDEAKGFGISLQNSTLPRGFRFFQVQYRFSQNIWVYFHRKKNIQYKLMKLPDVTTCQNIVMLLLPATLGMYLMGWDFYSDIFPRNKKTPPPPAPQLYKHIIPSELFIAPKRSLLCGYITFFKNSLFSPFSRSYLWFLPHSRDY